MFSDIQIEVIIKKAASSYDVNRLTKSKREQFLVTLRSSLLAARINYDVCHKCLGSGRADLTHQCSGQQGDPLFS